MAKYTTLTKLAAAFRAGEFDESYKVVIDKGGCALHLSQFKDFRDDPDAENAAFERCQELFRREYGCCLEELFALAGIPCEWA